MGEQLYIEEVTYSKYRVRIPDGKIIQTDENFECLLGYSKEDIEKQDLKLWDIMLPEDWEPYAHMVMQTFGIKNEAYLAHRLRKKDGKVIFVFCFGKQIEINEKGEVLTEILITDITNTKTLQNQVTELSGINADLAKENIDKNKILESVLNNLADGVCVCEVDRGIASVRYMSDSFYEQFGVTKEQMKEYLGDITALVYPEDKKRLEKAIRETIVSNRATLDEFRFIDINHPGVFWVQLCMSVLSVHKGKFTVCAVILNVSQKKADEVERNMQNELLKLVIEGSGEKLLSYDLDKDILFINHFKEGMVTELYHSDHFLAGIKQNSRIFFEDREELEKLIREVIKTAGKRSLEARMDMDKRGQYLWYRVMIVGIMDNSGHVRKLVGRMYSIHEEKMQNQEMLLRAERDSLTGIYNYSTFITKVNSMLQYYPGSLCAFYMVDIDNFKLINDAYGHYEGDDLLCETAAGLEQLASMHGGFSGRLGGDEFAVFFPDIENQEKAVALARTLTEEMAKVPCKTAHTVSVGACLLTIDKNVDFAQLHYQADQALYDSKRKGKSQFVFFAHSEQEKADPSVDIKDSYHAEEGYLMDDIEHPIYISDINTYELYFLNRAAKTGIGLSETDEAWKGRKCYEVIYHKDRPCEFCTNKALKKEKSVVWNIKGEIDGRDYVLKDKIIDWYGRKCRMEMALCIFNSEQIANALAERIDMEDALSLSLRSIALSGEDDYNYIDLLGTIGMFYGANHSCILQYEGETGGSIYKWKNSNAKTFGDSLEIFLKPETRACMDRMSASGGVLIIRHAADVEKTIPEIYQFCVEHRVWSIYSVPIRDNDNICIGRIMVFNPKLHSGDIRLLNLLALYIGNVLVKQKLWETKQYELKHDSLTRTLNRNSYIEYASRLVSAKTMGVVIIDVNDVRVINEEFGQTYADHVLVQFVDKMRDIFPGNEIYRMGHDDFIMVCENIPKDTFLEKIDILKSQFQKGMFTACVGYVWDDYDIDIRRMEEHAYDLLYMEKQRWYDYKDEHSYKWNTLSGQLLKEELKQNKFHVFLQPKVDYRTGRFYGAEALVRYKEKENLADVLARLEKSRTIKYLDLFVLEQVCRILVEWQKKQISLIPVSCNFSRMSILEEGMTDRINEIVESYHVPKEMVEIEITESIGEMEHEMVIRMANKLHENGFRIAMDDFGTKYSNISILASLKFDVIKLDRSMVYNIDKNETSKKILKHLIGMCQDIGVECVAEGVETEEQAEILQEIGCPLLQGFLYSRPVCAGDFTQMYQENISRQQTENRYSEV